MVAYIALSSSYLAPNIAATHRLVAVNERAVASAMFLFIVNLVGLGLGPTLAGVLSDALRDYFVSQGDPLNLATGDGLRWSLRILILVNVFAIWFYLIGAKKVREEAIG
jgi:MFS family permease